MNSFTILEIIPRPTSPFLLVPLMILLSLVLIAYIKQRNNAISISFNSFFNLRFFRQSIREETNTSLKFSRLLLLNSFIVITVVLNYFIGNDIASIVSLGKESTFLILFVLIVVWFVINIGVKKAVASISNTRKIELEDRRYNQYFFQTLGLFLLPGVIGLYFSPSVILGVDFIKVVDFYIKLVVISLLLNKVIQSVLQSFEIKISWVYIFLYICTLEILPLCVGYQLLVR